MLSDHLRIYGVTQNHDAAILDNGHWWFDLTITNRVYGKVQYEQFYEKLWKIF